LNTSVGLVVPDVVWSQANDLSHPQCFDLESRKAEETTEEVVNDDHGLNDSRLKYLCRLDKGLVGETDGLPHSIRCKPTEGMSLNDLLNGFA